MGVIRGILLVIVTVLLFLSFLSATLLWTLSSSLTYDNVQKESVAVVGDLLQDSLDVTSHIKEIYPIMQLYCQNQSNYFFDYEGYTFDISCSVALQGENAIIDEGVKNLVYNVYYAEYDCNFWDCIEKSPIPMFLISKKAYDYWNNKFYLSLITCLVLLVLMFLLVEKKTNAPILAGSLLIISSLPFIKLDSLLNLFADKTFVKFLGIFFSQAYPVSIKILIAGIVLLAIGIVLKIFKVGFFISDIISKFKKKGKKKPEKIVEKVEKKEKKKKKTTKKKSKSK